MEEQRERVQVRVLAEVDAEKIRVFKALVGIVSRLALSSGTAHLDRIDIVPDDEIETYVNALIVEHGGEPGYETGPNGPTDMALTFQGDDRLHSYVIIKESVVQDIDPQHPLASNEVVRALLEEIIHIEWNALAQDADARDWQQMDSCSADIYFIAMKIRNEYVTNRWKAEILATTPLIEVNDELTTCLLRSDPIVDRLEWAAEELARITRDQRLGRADYKVTWGRVIRLVWRGILEPLSYDAGRRAPYMRLEQLVDEASASSFFQRNIQPYWQEILEALDSLRADNPGDIEDATEQVVASITELIISLGICIRKQGRACRIDFGPRFLFWV